MGSKMPSTYQLISSNVLTSSAASVTFSAIPSTYTDLVLRLSVRQTTATTSITARVRFNSSSSGYSFTILRSNNGTASSYAMSGDSYVYPGHTPAASSTANTFGSAEIYIPSYLVSQNKPISTFGVNENNATTIGNNIIAAANLWQNTAAITSMEILPTASGSFDTGSSFYLYGIKNS
jgi:hypothetical protein